MNLSTSIILAVLAVIIGTVIRGMIRDKRVEKGCSGCSGCSGCPSGGCGTHQDVHGEHRQEERRRNWA